jgi:peptidoglycan/xylan/chitin deacetylase (PgdA/CDA1 family)
MRHRRARRPWTAAVAEALARVPDYEIGPGRLVSLVLLFTGVTALLVGPSPAGRYVGHRLGGSSAAARSVPGAGVPAGAAGNSRSDGSQPQAANPAPTGPATAPQPSGPASPSASRSARPDPVAGALRRTGSAAVALTFDDGPDPVQTPLLLDLLKEHGVKATFCMVGFRVRDHPDLVRRIAAEGHTLCNHSWQHLLNLAKRDPEYIRHDLANTNNAIRAAVPDAKIAYFRAPGGNFTPDLVAIVREFGMTSIYWHVDPRDWDHKKDPSDPAHIARVVAAVQRYTRPGSIVLSHDNAQPDTILAYRELLPWLKSRFQLEPMPT